MKSIKKWDGRKKNIEPMIDKINYKENNLVIF